MGDCWDIDDVPASAAAVEAAVIPKAEMIEIKLFGRWNTDDVQVSDISLAVSKKYNL